jgi:hypothetical protein
MLSEKEVRALLKKAEKDYKWQSKFTSCGILHLLFGFPTEMSLKKRIDTLKEVLEEKPKEKE